MHPTNRAENPFDVVARLRKAIRGFGGCLHADAPAGCGEIIDAHSIQRTGPLQHLTDDQNRVQWFNPLALARQQPEPIGWHEASTFKGLCSVHDQVFTPIETKPFVGDSRQVFLTGYRSLLLEIHQKRAVIAACEKVSLETLASIYPRSEHEERLADEHLKQEGRRKGLAEMQEFRKTYDRVLKLNTFDSLSSCVVWFKGTLSAASTGLVTPDFSISGGPLQELHLPDMEFLTFGVVATGEGGAAVFSWPRNMEKMTIFVESLVAIPWQDLPGALLMFMFSYVSNTFFSRSWWESLRVLARIRLEGAARTPVQYYTPVNYRLGRVVDWKITDVAFRSESSRNPR